jgi:hypothetical protein
MSEGVKYDAGKPRWSLLPDGVISDVVRVLEFGATRYGENNWKHVPHATTRYYDAAMRHMDAWWQGEMDDPETGMCHLAHAMCCISFLLWLEREANREEP